MDIKIMLTGLQVPHKDIVCEVEIQGLRCIPKDRPWLKVSNTESGTLLTDTFPVRSAVTISINLTGISYGQVVMEQDGVELPSNKYCFELVESHGQTKIGFSVPEVGNYSIH